jgi:Fe-S oxidoreductase
VSNAEPRETLTPWGKMSLAYFVAQGDVPATPSYAQPAWACTGCLACREACDHRNEVAPTLFDARAGLTELGALPEAAARTIRSFPKHADATRQAVRELGTVAAVQGESKTALLVGCAYARGAPREARDAVHAAAGLSEGPVSLVEACCGLPLLHAGDRAAFERQAHVLATETGDKRVLLVADAGCAHALRVHYPSARVTLSPTVELLVERAARDLGRLSAAPPTGIHAGPVRYHDPCLLGRGLGVYEAPRAVLTRALGRAPDEFDARRAGARCSGAGGLLPRTMPETSRAITDARRAEHTESGGGHVVTACASSLAAFRRGGPASDLVTWIARSVPPWRP